MLAARRAVNEHVEREPSRESTLEYNVISQVPREEDVERPAGDVRVHRVELRIAVVVDLRARIVEAAHVAL